MNLADLCQFLGSIYERFSLKPNKLAESLITYSLFLFGFTLNVYLLDRANTTNAVIAQNVARRTENTVTASESLHLHACCFDVSGKLIPQRSDSRLPVTKRYPCKEPEQVRQVELARGEISTIASHNVPVIDRCGMYVYPYPIALGSRFFTPLS